jgi:stearoyl-CoA desaturase (delta-9 desaturase)
MLLVVPFVGFSWTALAFCIAAYLVRVFALTAGFHRYFSHRSYKTSRVFQFILAFVGTSAAQLGPIWWASHHRHHHEYSDQPEDIHSPSLKGFFRSHIGWVMCKKYVTPQYERVGDLTKYPELMFLDRFSVVAPLCLGLTMYGIGHWLSVAHPALGTTGWQMVMWGFFVSTVMTYHATFCINSLTHIFGTRRFKTKDHSRNNFWLALLTFGEGWHNNHHRYPIATRQGLYWWEIDLTWYILSLFQKLGIIWDMNTHPQSLYEEAERLSKDPDLQTLPELKVAPPIIPASLTSER